MGRPNELEQRRAKGRTPPTIALYERGAIVDTTNDTIMYVKNKMCVSNKDPEVG